MDLRTIATAVEAEKRGVLPAEKRAALNELRARGKGKGLSLAQFVEPMLTMATGAIAEPVSGFVGLAGLPFGGDVAANAVRRTQDALTYQPKTEAGQKGLQAVGEAIAPIAEPLGKARDFVADKTADTLGAEAGTAVYTALTAAPDLLGLKAANMAGKAGKLGKQYELGDISGQAFGQRGIFGGIKAKNADMDAYNKAVKMTEEGADRDAIWNETGWFQDVDGAWKFEIDDSEMGFNKDYTSDDFAKELNAISQHEELFGQYPDVSDMDVIGGMGRKGEEGVYSPATSGDDYTFGRSEEIGLGTENRKSVLAHELQHAIQAREGFAEGGAVGAVQPDSWLTDLGITAKELSTANALSRMSGKADNPHAEINKGKFERVFGRKPTSNEVWLAETYVPEWISEQANIIRAGNDFEVYRRLAGEAEARNVETRLDMTPEERKANPPWKTLDVPENELIVRRGSEKAMSVGGAGSELFTGAVDNIPSGGKYRGEVYHSTDQDFDKFDFDKSADGTAWFTTDKNALSQEGSAAAAASGRGKIVVANIELNKVAGWDEIDKYSIDELIQQGYDGAILDGDVQVFDPEAIKQIGRDKQEKAKK